MEHLSTPQHKDSFTISLIIASRLDHLRLIRGAVKGILSNLNIRRSDIELLELAVSEVASNSIEYGYRNDCSQQIEVQVCVSGNLVTLKVIDSAPPFPTAEFYRLLEFPLQTEDPSESWSQRGHGLQIVKQIADSITHHLELGQNCFTIMKCVRLYGR